MGFNCFIDLTITSISKQLLKDFLDEIKNQDPPKDYVFGTILFQEKGKDGAFDIIDIVNGQ